MTHDRDSIADGWAMSSRPDDRFASVRSCRLARWASVALIGLCAHGRADAQAPEPIWDAPRYVGTGSCAAGACHGGRREPLGLRGSEYSFWAEFDPHQRAYQVLFGERSKQIERNYRRVAKGEETLPERDATCLGCHVHAGFEPPAIEREASIVADGVGCESCHGPASRWLVPHTERTWLGLAGPEKTERFGMTDTKALSTRARRQLPSGYTRRRREP